MIKDIIYKYLKVYPNEDKLLEILNSRIDNTTYEELIDWNNFNGHIVASGFIYDKDRDEFLVIYHKDLDMYLYPGGHMTSEDLNPLNAAIREVREETGIDKLEEIKICDDSLVPIDIDTHKIKYNARLDLPEHYHFDFRYLFVCDNVDEIIIDDEESSDYRWVTLDYLKNNTDFGNVLNKIENIINNYHE